jgi:hypothetical protein
MESIWGASSSADARDTVNDADKADVAVGCAYSNQA